jgi:hypothetical protein
MPYIPGGKPAHEKPKEGIPLNDIETSLDFDESRAQRYAPLRVMKIARVIKKTNPCEVSVVDAEWGERMTFTGSYVEIIDPETGAVKYGSALDEWMNTHTPWTGVADAWYKSSPVDAYVSDEEGVIYTVLKCGHLETPKPHPVHVGDWLVRQKDGEIMCIIAAKFPTLYDADNPQPIS